MVREYCRFLDVSLRLRDKRFRENCSRHKEIQKRDRRRRRGVAESATTSMVEPSSHLNTITDIVQASAKVKGEIRRSSQVVRNNDERWEPAEAFSKHKQIWQPYPLVDRANKIVRECLAFCDGRTVAPKLDRFLSLDFHDFLVSTRFCDSTVVCILRPAVQYPT